MLAAIAVLLMANTSEQELTLWKHDAIAEALGMDILSGALSEGSRMPSEAEFLERFDSSRVVLREVHKTLAAKGLVTAKAKVGTRVQPAREWNWLDPQLLAWRVKLGVNEAFLRQLVQMRLAVEPAAAGLAAEYRTAEQMMVIDASVTAMGNAGIRREAYVESDVDFHLGVGAASGNSLFGSFANVVEVALRAMFSISAPAELSVALSSVASHARIAEAIRDRDSARAAEAMRLVIMEGGRNVAAW